MEKSKSESNQAGYKGILVVDEWAGAKNTKKRLSYGPTNGTEDGQTDGWTDQKVVHTVACPRLKTGEDVHPNSR